MKSPLRPSNHGRRPSFGTARADEAAGPAAGTAPPAAAASARELGRRLAEARLARGEDAEDIADYLRIRSTYLDALERGDLGRIPAGPYLAGFLRSYGYYLGVDVEPFIAGVRSSGAASARPELLVREPIAEARRGTAVMVTASLLLASAVYAGYYVIYRVDRGTVEQVAEAPGEVARMASDVLRQADLRGADLGQIERSMDARAAARAQPGAAAGTASAALAHSRPSAGGGQPIPALSAPEEGHADAGSALAAEIRTVAEPPRPAAGPVTTAASVPAAAAPLPAAEQPRRQPVAILAGTVPPVARELLHELESDRVSAARPGPATAAAATAGEEDSARLVLRALESSWVQVRSGSRDYVRTRTLEPGERFVLPNRSDLSVWTVNGGGVELVVDGRNRGPLGQPGEVVKSLPLLPDAFRVRAAFR